MCPPSSSTTKGTMKLLRRKRPVQHRLMKAKNFVQEKDERDAAQPKPQRWRTSLSIQSPESLLKAQQLQQLQARSQRSKPQQTMIELPEPTQAMNEGKKKSVRFQNRVQVIPFEKVSSTEAKDVWFDSNEMLLIRAESREISATYRKLFDRCVIDGIAVNQQQQNLLLLQQQQQRQYFHCNYDYRGFENCTVTRRKQRLIANSVAVYASSLQRYKPEEIAAMYRQCNAWSKQVAFLQAIHDYTAVYPTIGTDMEQLTKALPPVSSMVPPQISSPFVIEAAMMVQQYKRIFNNRKKRRALPSPTLSSSSQFLLFDTATRPPSPPLSPTPIVFEQPQQQQQQLQTERRVRQRVF